jgi:hypothetical protein
VGEKGNYNQMLFANTYVDATFYISLNDSKCIKEYKYQNGVNIGKKNVLI